jgi:signal transduction histidine kinase
MKARLVAAGLRHDAAQARPAPAAGGSGEPVSARVAQARSRARERGDAARQALRPLGLVFLAIVVIASVQTSPAPGLRGAGLAVALVLVLYAATVLTAITVGWARRGLAAQAATVALIGGCGVALAALQPHGPAGLAASLGVWIAAVRMPPVPAAVTAGAITAALALTVGLTAQPPVQSALTAVLICLLLAVIGQFLRRSRESQDRTEMLLAQLQDAQEAEAAAAALAERTRIAGELHDVLAHSLSALAIQLQGARKLAGREPVSDRLRATIERSADLVKAGLADARQAVGALRGDRLTNISRYAPGASTAITVSYQAGRTMLTVEDHARPPAAAPSAAAGPRPGLLADAGGGHGLESMRERVQRAGGTARAGPTADGWRVELEVPA